MEIHPSTAKAIPGPTDAEPAPGAGYPADPALNAADAELRLKSLILESSEDGLIAHTIDGRPLYFNEIAATRLGYTRDEFAALGPYGWVGDDIALIPSRLAVIRERGSLLYQSRGASKDGHVVHTEVNARLVRNEGGDFVVAVIRDVTERVLAHEQIRHLAFHDRLTGLANRMKLEDDLRTALASADRHDDLVGVVYLDLDDFKPVNDELGHAAGDGVLTEVAGRMTSCVRECDTVARLGGDEFLVLVTRMAARSDLAQVAAKLAECIEQPISVPGSGVVRVTASVGLATYEQGEAAEDLMNRADHAMYRAKQAGLQGWEAFLEED
jgi:diguanylate cyclase (GGDEF)-like protein/PAS domain S-box-containing protein